MKLRREVFSTTHGPASKSTKHAILPHGRAMFQANQGQPAKSRVVYSQICACTPATHPKT
eukprot:4923730-Pleurochrysis_carterae.AAC.7